MQNGDYFTLMEKSWIHVQQRKKEVEDGYNYLRHWRWGRLKANSW